MAVKIEKTKQSSPSSTKWDADPATVRTLTQGGLGAELATEIAAINAIQGIPDQLRQQLLSNAKAAASSKAGGLTVSLIRGTVDSKGKRMPDLIKIDGVYRGINRSTAESIITYAEQIQQWLSDCDAME